MNFDVEAGRAVIQEAKDTAAHSGPDANVVYPVIEALSDALDEITRLRGMLQRVHVALECPRELLREPAAPVEKRDALGRAKPSWCRDEHVCAGSPGSGPLCGTCGHDMR